MTTEEAQPRPGSSIDLSRRMDRIEARQDTIESKVTDLASVVSRVEQNQTHAREIDELRYKTLNTAIENLGATLNAFMGRVNAIISGEVRLPGNEALMKEWRDWRDSVNAKLELSEAKLDEQAVLNGQVRLLGKLAVLLVSGNVLAIIAAVAAILK